MLKGNDINADAPPWSVINSHMHKPCTRLTEELHLLAQFARPCVIVDVGCHTLPPVLLSDPVENFSTPDMHHHKSIVSPRDHAFAQLRIDHRNRSKAIRHGVDDEASTIDTHVLGITLLNVSW